MQKVASNQYDDPNLEPQEPAPSLAKPKLMERYRKNKVDMQLFERIGAKPRQIDLAVWISEIIFVLVGTDLFDNAYSYVL